MYCQGRAESHPSKLAKKENRAKRKYRRNNTEEKYEKKKETDRKEKQTNKQRKKIKAGKSKNEKVIISQCYFSPILGLCSVGGSISSHQQVAKSTFMAVSADDTQ